MFRYQFMQTSAVAGQLCSLSIFYPESPAVHPASVFIVRSGGWRSSTPSSMHVIAGAFADRGMVAAVADYPSNAKNAFEQLAALRRAYQFFQRELLSAGFSSDIVVLGLGAGGHIGSLMTCTLPGECGEVCTLIAPWLRPIAGCFISTPVQFTPWKELFPRTWAEMQDIAGASYQANGNIYDRLSLKKYLSGDVPPLFFAEGEEDHTIFPYFSKDAVSQLTSRGKIAQWRLYPLAGPSFLTHLSWAPCKKCFEDILSFIDGLQPKSSAPLQVKNPAVGVSSPGHERYGIYLDNPIQPKRGVNICLPPENTPMVDTALFIVHGGGWRAGDRDKLTAIAEEFARYGVVTASAGYRQDAPTVFEMLADVRESYEVFVQELRRLGRPMKIAVYGESAGAHLASLLAAAAPGECGEKCHLTAPWVAPAAMILQSSPAQFTPWENIDPAIWRSMEEVTGAPYAEKPKYFERLSLSSYIRQETPEIFWAEAQFEVFFPHHLNAELAKRLKALGVPTHTKTYALAEHGFFYQLDLPDQKEFFQDILLFLKGQCMDIKGMTHALLEK